MTHTIRIHEFGGPEVLRWETSDVGDPGPDEVRLRHTAVGLNFIDVYHRSGLYPLPVPLVPGTEAAGVVEAVGSGVGGWAVGDRAAYALGTPGAYCEARLIDAGRLVRLPDAIGDEPAAAMMLKGMTAWYLLHRSYPVQAGDTVLLTAAAGGVGLIAAQWAKHLGARVIGTAGSAEKAALARAHGCDEVILYREECVPERVRALTGGEGVSAVYDSVGRATFNDSLDSLRRHGVMVSYGNASGPVEPVSPLELAKRGSLFLTRPVLFDFIRTRAELEQVGGCVFDVVAGGAVRVEIRQRYPLREAARAHEDLAARRTTGSSVLLP